MIDQHFNKFDGTTFDISTASVLKVIFDLVQEARQPKEAGE